MLVISLLVFGVAYWRRITIAAYPFIDPGNLCREVYVSVIDILVCRIPSPLLSGRKKHLFVQIAQRSIKITQD